MARPWNTAWLATVEDALGRGVPHDTIIATLRDDLGISSRRARRYIDAVLASWTERMTSATLDEQRGELVGLAMSVYREARRKGHAKTALAAIDTTARLLGLTRPDAQVAINVLDAGGALTSQDAVRERLAELRQRQLTSGGNDGGA